MRIFNYCRKSVYSESSDSITNQKRMCREYVESRFRVDSWTEFSDEDYSGSNTARPGLSAMLELIKADQCDLLVVYALDRLSRNVRDFSNIYGLLEEHNVSFVCLDRNIDTSTPIGEAIMYISAAFAQMERKTIATRVTDNMIGLAKAGFWVGGNPPVGYKREPVIINGRKHTTIVPVPEQADYVRELFNLFLLGNFTLTGFETYHRRNRIRGPRGGFVSSVQLWQILTSPFYCPATPEAYDYFKQKGCQMESDREAFDGSRGVSVYGRTSEKSGKHIKNPPDKWRVMVGMHEPILTAETWLAAQGQMAQHKYVRMKRVHPPALLQGALRCKCGCLMGVQRRKRLKGMSVWYYCTKRSRSGPDGCDMRFVRAEILENKVLEVFREIALDPELIKSYEAPVAPAVDEKQIRSLQKKIEKLTASLATAKNSSASKYIIAEIERLDAELMDLNTKKAQEYSKPSEPDVGAIQTLITDFDDFTPEEKNQIIIDTVQSLTWDGDVLSIVL